MFLISIHHLPKCRPKTCCGATLFQIKSLHLRLFLSVIPNPRSGVLFLGCISAFVGAVHCASFRRERFSAVLAPFGGKPLQGCIQFRIIGQYALPEIPTHSISTVNLLQHHAVTIQWQAAEIFVIIGTALCHKLSDSSSFFFGQFPNVFCHGQMIPFCFISCEQPFMSSRITPSLIGDLRGVQRNHFQKNF